MPPRAKDNAISVGKESLRPAAVFRVSMDNSTHHD